MGSRVHPIVLAAGASSRMGFPKALLRFRGSSALELILGCCRRAGTEDPLVVLGHDKERIAPEAERLGYRVVTNPCPEQGQTSSLKAGVRALEAIAGALLIFPVDQPLVAPATIEALARAWRARRQETPIVVPRHGDRCGHPALLDLTLREEILALGDKQPAHEVIWRVPARMLDLEVDDHHVLDRINTRQEYERTLESLARE
jgi:molybdenum cofactor cytidylyltransferase